MQGNSQRNNLSTSNQIAKCHKIEFPEFSNILLKLNNLKEILSSAETGESKITQSSNNANLDSILSGLTDSLNKYNEKLILEKDFLREFLESLAGWILKNFSSPKLNNLLNFVILFFNSMNYRVEILKEEIIKILEVETYEEIKINEKKEKVDLKDTEIISNDCFISNPFLSAFYALIVTIANKPEIIVKSKNLLKNVITILTQICEIDNIAIYYKKKRLISVFMKILKELSKSPEAEDSLLQISKLLTSLFSKLGFKRKIYRDYLFKKSIPEKITDLYMKFFKKDIEFVKSFGIFVHFSCRISDHKVFYWTKGIIENFILILRKLLESTNSKNNLEEEKVIESITFAIYNLSLDSTEIQSELIDLNFLDIYKQLLMKFSKNNFIIYNIISCLRRFKDDEYMNKLAEDLLFTFFALFDYFYLSLKNKLELQSNAKLISEQKNLVANNKIKDENYEISFSFELTILKEIIGLLGNIVKNEVHQKPFMDKNMHIVLIDVILSFIDYPKIIKNSIGAMINLSNNNDIRNEICKVAAFVKSIFLVFEKYNSTQMVVDYELKLLINILKNDLSSKIFANGELFNFILFFLNKYENNEEVYINSIKILRALLINKKGLEIFFEKLMQFYEENKNLIKNISDVDKKLITQKDLTSSLAVGNKTEPNKNPVENVIRDKRMIFYKSFVDNLVDFLIQKYEEIEVAIEILLFISHVANQDEIIKTILEKNQSFFTVLRKIVNMNSSDEVIGKLISQCIAQLPIEEFDSNNYYTNFNKN